MTNIVSLLVPAIPLYITTGERWKAKGTKKRRKNPRSWKSFLIGRFIDAYLRNGKGELVCDMFMTVTLQFF